MGGICWSPNLSCFGYLTLFVAGRKYGNQSRKVRASMRDVFLCDAIRTPIGRYGGALAKVRTDDLAAVPIKALMARNPKVDWDKLEEVYYGCANQAGEDNRNVARMA